MDCDNPIYQCLNETNFIERNKLNCDKFINFDCEGQEICNTPKIPAKSCIETKTNFLHKHFLNIYLILLAVGFLINHLLWRVKK